MARSSRGALFLGIAALASISWVACGGGDDAAPADADVGDEGTTNDGATADGVSSEGGSLQGDGGGDARGDGDASAASAFCIRAADAGVPGPQAAGDPCLARLPIAGKNLRYYRSHDLEHTNNAINDLVVIQHGNNRNAWDYYDLMATAAFARDPAHTAVVAPHFQASGNACADGPDVV